MKKRFTLVCQVLHATHLVSLYLFPFLLPHSFPPPNVFLLFASSLTPYLNCEILPLAAKMCVGWAGPDSSSDEDSAGN